MPEIAISSGSACTSSSPAPSHVLNEIGIMCGKITKALQEIPIQKKSQRHLWEMHNAKETLEHYLKLGTHLFERFY